VTTATPHGLIVGDKVLFTDDTGTGSLETGITATEILGTNGVDVATVISDTEFTIAVTALAGNVANGTSHNNNSTTFAGNGTVNKTATTSSTGTVTSPSLTGATLYVDYVYLDTDERRRFAQVSHEYLIEQVQFTGEETIQNTNERVRINFNHPIKELVWVINPIDNETVNGRTDYIFSGDDGVSNDYALATLSPLMVSPIQPMTEAKIELNGHDRFSERQARYFNHVQPYQHHTRIPTNKGIYVYSFAIAPEDHQPSGTANFSRIDNATMSLSTVAMSNDARLRMYAVNYNVLRVMSGMAGLAYSS
jgi:hypothetical protein